MEEKNSLLKEKLGFLEKEKKTAERGYYLELSARDKEIALMRQENYLLKEKTTELQQKEDNYQEDVL